MALNSRAPSTLRLHTWRMTDQADGQGFFLLDRHAIVTITLNGLRFVSVNDFDLPGIIMYLEINRAEVGTGYTGTMNGTQPKWDGSYGVEGTLTAREARFDVEPGKPKNR